MIKVSIHSGRGLRLNRVGLYDINRLYKGLKEWFSDHEYDYFEKKDVIKMKRKGVEVNFVGVGERKVDGYVKFVINVEILTTHMEKVRFEGKTIDRGRIEVIVKTDMILDYKNEYSNSKFGKFLLGIYNRYVIRFKLDDFYGAKAYGDMVGVHEALKEALELYHV